MNFKDIPEYDWEGGQSQGPRQGPNISGERLAICWISKHILDLPPHHTDDEVPDTQALVVGLTVLGQVDNLDSLWASLQTQPSQRGA